MKKLLAPKLSLLSTSIRVLDAQHVHQAVGAGTVTSYTRATGATRATSCTTCPTLQTI